MSSLLVRGEGGRVAITPASAGWRYVSFSTARVGKGARFVVATEESEVCIVILGGRCSVRIGVVNWPEVGERETPFDGPPHVLYVPPGTEFSAESVDGPVDLAIGSAPASAAGARSASQSVRALLPGSSSVAA